jgi:hypothetical protein
VRARIGIQCDLDFVSDRELVFEHVGLKLFDGDNGLGLETGTDDYDIVIYCDNDSGDDGTGFDLSTRKTFFK